MSIFFTVLTVLFASIIFICLAFSGLCLFVSKALNAFANEHFIRER